jgi:hypothetical protein
MTMRLLRPALVLLAVILVTPLAAAPPGGPSSAFRVTGDVTKRTSFDLQTLEALPVTKENVTYFAAGAVVPKHGSPSGGMALAPEHTISASRICASRL